jgi:hypothetical protein
MALNNLAGLKAAAAAWIERTNDIAVTSIVDDCVTLCESRINQTPTLRVPEMETEATLTLVDGAATLPTDFLAMKRVVANTSPTRLISYAEPGWYAEAYPSSGTDESSAFYSIVGRSLQSRSSATLGIVYYARVPALATTDPNWLLTKAPDVYLYGTILELLVALEGDQQDKYAGLFGSSIESLVAAQAYSRGGVLTQRASMPAP